jgi:hypothetical protein
MASVDRKKIESELNAFALRNFERPSDCKDLDQIRFYIRELCVKIEDLEKRFEYVPHAAYKLLAQYNQKQNSIINKDFDNLYQ